MAEPLLQFLASQPDLDPSVLAEGLDDSRPEVEPGPPEPEDDEAEITLDEEERAKLIEDVIRKIELCDEALTERRAIEEEINENYDMVAVGEHGGDTPGAATLVSEQTTMYVDQVAAMFVTNVMSVEPLVQLEPYLAGEGPEAKALADLARRVTMPLNNYVLHEVDFDNHLPIAMLLAVKLGNAVFRLGWEKERYRVFASRPGTQGEGKSRIIEKERPVAELMPIHRVLLWPLDIVDWQRDYEVIGHRDYFTPWGAEAFARRLGASDEDVAKILAHRGDADEEGVRELERQGVASPDRGKDDPICLTELWCQMPLPGDQEKRLPTERFQVIFHEASRTLLHVRYNTRRNCHHPYRPLRYKMKGKFALADGVGHETRYVHAADTAFRNLEVDSLQGGAFWVQQVVTGSLADRVLDRLRPGMKIPVSEIDADFKPTKMGGDVPELRGAISDNQARGRDVASLPDPMRGLGDPRMKSGADTGSTLALIENARTKFEMIGQRMRLDLSSIYSELLQLLVDNASDLYLESLGTADEVAALRSLRQQDPYRPLSATFKIWVQAPSESSSKASRKDAYMVLWKFALDYANWLLQAAVPLVEKTSPAASERFQREIFAYLQTITERVVENSDVPGVKDTVPVLPDPTPPEQIIDKLMADTQRLEQIVMQQSQQMAALQAPPPAGQMMPGQPPMQPPIPGIMG